MELGNLEYSNDELLVRVILNMVRVAKKYNFEGSIWFFVSDLFGLGSTASKSLCLKYGIDPNLEIQKEK